jgi:ParB family chromosome partitioning protein
MIADFQSGDLHRHAAVRTKLAEAMRLTLPVTAAYLSAGSPLWNVRIEP